MHTTREAAQASGKVGGHRRAAFAATRQEITSAARGALWQQYREQVLRVLPELAGDDAEVDRRAAQLRQADMASLSRKAAKARAEARRLKAELDGLAEMDGSTPQTANDAA